MKTALFVDDEANVLSGLQRMLRSLRHEWRFETAASGPAALQLLDRQPFDIVVSDMKMPGMNGAELLAQVRLLHPASIRIVLSGEAERSAILESIASSHQFLSKPCEAQTLKETLERASGLGGLLASDELKRLVCSVEFLPSAPARFGELRAEFDQPVPAMPQIAKIIGQDVGMSVNVLKLVNSAYFGVGQPTADVERALACLGPETVRDLWGVPVFAECRGLERPALERLRLERARVAERSRAFAREIGLDPPGADQAYQAGLLHGVGRLVLAVSIPERYERLAQRAGAEEPLLELERRELGGTHAEVGAYLLGLWGLPQAIVEAVAYQARPRECPRQDVGVLTALHLARRAGTSPVDLEYLRGLGLEAPAGSRA